MRRLIRFEDAYGVKSMYELLYPIYGNTISMGGDRRLVIPNEGDICEFGITSPKVFMLDSYMQAIIKQYEISEIVLVYDMDSVTGKGILTHSDLISHLADTEKWCKSNNVSIRLVPVVWAAETLALFTILRKYKYFCKLSGKQIDVAEVVHLKNTPRCLGVILDKILSDEGVKAKYKHIHSYITLADINVHLRKYVSKINYPVIDFLFEKQTLSYIEGLLFQYRIESYYANLCSRGRTSISIGNTVLSLTKKCW